MGRGFFDKNTFNIIALAVLSLVESLQLLIIVVLVFSFIAIPIPALVYKFYPLTQYDVHLKRDMSFYHLWIALGIGLQGLLIFLNRQRLGEDNLWRKCTPYICTMAAILMIQIFAVFKMLLWGNPWWARDLFYFGLGFGILARIFWPECRRLLALIWTFSIPRGLRILLEAGGVGIVSMLIFAPDLSKVLTRMFSYDKFYHLDSFIMSPAWAHHQGLVLNKDICSEYSLIIPIVFDGLMKLAGGFSYAHAVGTMIALSAIYYLLLYGLWRYWTKSAWLSFFALVVSIKLQFFHWGVVPLIWIYPSATPIRYLPDVVFLFFILRFTQSISLRWLLFAAIVNGLALAWIMDVGAYMYLVLLTATAAYAYHNNLKFLHKAIGVLLIPGLVALGVLSVFYGPLIWQGGFWQNTSEFARLFLQGWGALPITDGLNDKQFFAFCMGFVIPVVYLATLLYGMGMFIYRQSRPHLFMILVSVYGLGLYHYFIHRSGVTSYYAVVIPLIFVLLFWIQACLESLTIQWQRGLKIFLCVWALTALMTSFLFLYYPSPLNLSGYDWSQEKLFYVKNFDFNQDAALIDSLTAGGESVPLISSFETKILMQANRRPFFYYFPMMESEHMQGDKLRGIYLHTYARLERTLNQLQDQKPAHLFIQTRLYQGPQAQGYEDSHEGFKLLMAFIRMHYQYQAQGQYLTALILK